LVKVDANSNLMATYPGNPTMYEIWRMIYNPCTRQVVIGGGGVNQPNNYQVAMLDTTLATLIPENPLNATSCCRDVDRLCMDPNGSTAYFAISTTSYSNAVTIATSDNVLMSVPVPALNPANYILQPTGDAFSEVSSVNYVGTGIDSANDNGMNGMAASPNWLYMYDSYHLKKVTKGTGAVSKSITITAATTGANKQVIINWGGLD